MEEKTLTEIEHAVVQLLEVLKAQDCSFILTIHDPKTQKDIRQLNGNVAWVIGEAHIVKSAAVRKIEEIGTQH